MRGAIALAAGTLAAAKPTMTRDHIVMAYTFHTQSMTSTAVNLGALPYSPTLPASFRVPAPGSTAVFCKNAPACGGQTSSGTVDDVFDRYGVDRSFAPDNNI